jgi:hypothetical protein
MPPAGGRKPVRQLAEHGRRGNRQGLPIKCSASGQ